MVGEAARRQARQSQLARDTAARYRADGPGDAAEDGVEATRAITPLSPSTRVMVLTSFSEDEKVFASIKAGAQGYLMKDVLPQELVRAIRTVYQGRGPT